MTNDELKARYGASEQGNFAVCDTIGVPHPYTVGVKLVAFAADHHGGMLNEYAIQQAEKNGIHCAHPRCTLSYAMHKQALIVECKAPLQTDNQLGEKVANPELRDYLIASKDKCDADKFEGFAFLDRTKQRA